MSILKSDTPHGELVDALERVTQTAAGFPPPTGPVADLMGLPAVIDDHQAPADELEELERLRREDPCRYCGGSRVVGVEDAYGNTDACAACDGTGVDGGF